MPIDLKYGRVTLENQRNIGDDEPVVVFRAKDRLLPKLLKVYRYFCELAGSPTHHLEAIDRAAYAVKDWQAEHGAQTPQSAQMAPRADARSTTDQPDRVAEHANPQPQV